MPVHQASEPWLGRTIDAARDALIRIVISRPGSLWSDARNAALELVRGEFLALLDSGDELASHALYFVAEELNAYPDADIVYSDEDRVDEAGNRLGPFFKPDWSPDLLTSQYVSRLAAYRTGLVRRAGGFREETKYLPREEPAFATPAISISGRRMLS
jgi:glycosyltransferase involved in cell wall biosynthesis